MVLAPLGLFTVWAGGMIWSVWLALGTLGLACEWVGLCGFTVRSVPGAAVPLSLLVSCGFAAFGHPATAAAVLVLSAGAVWAWFGSAALGSGILYIGPATLSLLMLRGGPAGLGNVLFLLLVVWAADIGAYLAGRMIGGPRIAPRISPGKTWSGATGGAACAMLTGALVGWAHPWRAAVLALALGLVAEAGDLLESAIKRHFGAKDSGWVIPGHGGILDRLDGVLTASPAALIWSFWLGWGQLLWT
jgi:phosphatidate cytidylyltransferase